MASKYGNKKFKAKINLVHRITGELILAGGEIDLSHCSDEEIDWAIDVGQVFKPGDGGKPAVAGETEKKK